MKNINRKYVRYSEISSVPRPLNMSMDVSKAMENQFDIPTLESVMSALIKEYPHGTNIEV